MKTPSAQPQPQRALRIALLSRKASLYTTRRLAQAIERRGHTPLVVDPLRCCLAIARGAPRILLDGVELPPIDLAIPRIGASITQAGVALLTHLELMDVPTLNSAQGVAQSRDKLRCLQQLGARGFPVPATVLAPPHTDIEPLLARLGQIGGLPVVVKLLQGTQGIGVMLARTREELATLLDTFGELGHAVLVQAFVGESEGCDIRVLVAGERVVGAMRRRSQTGDFRSNLHRGGEATPIAALPAELADLAIGAARAVGLRIAGVDLITSSQGPMLIEINSSPGFEGLEKATHLDVADAIIERGLEWFEALKQGAPPEQRA
ncbi:MAG: RimK family alpha-L-glutamate ligase [Myxococcales bacterium]|nr:RimK family alpha-L-glutamate ligase [Myxococcales bacterium]